MRPFSFYINESITDQLKYFIIPKFGDSEYTTIINANPVGLLDGLMRLSITTKDKPTGIHADSIKKTSNGWVSIYIKNN